MIKRALVDYAKCDIYGFNSAKFDLKVLAPYLLPILSKKYGAKITVIKKGTCYFCIKTPTFEFKDAMLFSTPTSLSGYLLQGGIEEVKSIWPYEKYSSVYEIINDRNFPEFDEFFSSLKNKNISREEYEKSKKEFNEEQSRNPNYTMAHWLKNYNLGDVKPFAAAINNQFKVFQQTFKIDPSICMSLPKYAMMCVFDCYSKNAPLSCKFFKASGCLFSRFISSKVRRMSQSSTK